MIYTAIYHINILYIKIYIDIYHKYNIIFLYNVQFSQLNVQFSQLNVQLNYKDYIFK
jgi:hypothetical protein